jgi:hypothetical protein
MPQDQFTGESMRGDFQEALRNAISKATSSVGGTDKIVSWELQKIHGEDGGFVGFHKIFVVISVVKHTDPPKDAKRHGS